MPKRALIIGVSSQDGSYLADLLLERGYEVVGTIRRTTTYARENLAHLYGSIKIEAVELSDFTSIAETVQKYEPDEVYNIAAQSVPADSWSQPFYTADVTGVGVVRVLEAVRRYAPNARVYQATSREIYGNIAGESADEGTPIDANNPYGIAKAYAHMMARCYREAHNLFVTCGILFNHESPRRSLHFVTRKISAAAACIKNGVENPPTDERGEPLVDANGQLHLGWLDAERDWGYAKEYAAAMIAMVQHDEPRDFVIGTNTSYSVQQACEIAFDCVGLDWRKHVVTDEELIRPTEIKQLKGNYALAKKLLGWEPKTAFPELMQMMVASDLGKFSK